MKRCQTIRKKEDLKTLFGGSRLQSKHLRIYYTLDKTQEQEWFFVSIPKKKIPKAYERNLLKRRIRSIMNSQQEITAKKIKMGIVYKSSSIASYVDLTMQIQTLIEKI